MSRLRGAVSLYWGSLLLALLLGLVPMPDALAWFRSAGYLR